MFILRFCISCLHIAVSLGKSILITTGKFSHAMGGMLQCNQHCSDGLDDHFTVMSSDDWDLTVTVTVKNTMCKANSVGKMFMIKSYNISVIGLNPIVSHKVKSLADVPLHAAFVTHGAAMCTWHTAFVTQQQCVPGMLPLSPSSNVYLACCPCHPAAMCTWHAALVTQQQCVPGMLPLSPSSNVYLACCPCHPAAMCTWHAALVTQQQCVPGMLPLSPSSNVYLVEQTILKCDNSSSLDYVWLIHIIFSFDNEIVPGSSNTTRVHCAVCITHKDIFFKSLTIKSWSWVVLELTTF